jgi:hypothetical protein
MVHFVKFYFVILFCLCATVPIDAGTDRESDIAATLRGLEQLKFEAQEHKTTAALDALFDDGLMWVNERGALFTKAGLLETVLNSGLTQMRPESMNVKVFEGMAIVVGIYAEKGLRSGQPYRQHCRFIDT